MSVQFGEVVCPTTSRGSRPEKGTRQCTMVREAGAWVMSYEWGRWPIRPRRLLACTAEVRPGSDGGGWHARTTGWGRRKSARREGGGRRFGRWRWESGSRRCRGSSGGVRGGGGEADQVGSEAAVRRHGGSRGVRCPAARILARTWGHGFWLVLGLNSFAVKAVCILPFISPSGTIK